MNDAIDDLQTAADDLYTGGLEPGVARAALDRAEAALCRMPPSPLLDDERRRAIAEVICARDHVTGERGWELRAAANRLFASAVLLQQGAQPQRNVHLLLARFTLRAVLLAVEAGRPADAERAMRHCRAVWRVITLDRALASVHEERLAEELGRAEAALKAGAGEAAARATAAALREVLAMEAALMLQGSALRR